MKYCTKCGSEIGDEAVVCVHCGCAVGTRGVKYCTKCGQPINEDAVVCVHCGCAVEGKKSNVNNENDTLLTIIKIFMIIGCVVRAGFFIVSLAWTIPMTLKVWRTIKEGGTLTTGFKVCTLIFVDIVTGICMLCTDKI